MTDNNWCQRINPLALALRDSALEIVRKLSNVELEQLRIDCEKPTKHNCSFVIYEASGLLVSAVEIVQTERHK